MSTAASGSNILCGRSGNEDGQRAVGMRRAQTVYSFYLHLTHDMVQAVLNNTLQASPVACYRDAQTGGFIFCGGAYAIR